MTAGDPSALVARWRTRAGRLPQGAQARQLLHRCADELAECLGDRVDPLLTPAEVAAKFRVDPKTVTRWADDDRLSCVRTPGGHRRYRESEVRALLNGDGAS